MEPEALTQMTQRGAQTAFTLIESLLAAAILAMSITAVTLPFASAAQNEQINARKTVATSFAQELMEEILTRSFEDPEPSSARNPGPESDEYSRSDFDNIDDYDGYTDKPVETSVPGGEITKHHDVADLVRKVTAEYVYVTGQQVSDEPDFIQILVEVTHRQRSLVRLSRLVYRIPTEQESPR